MTHKAVELLGYGIVEAGYHGHGHDHHGHTKGGSHNSQPDDKGRESTLLLYQVTPRYEK